MKGSLISATHVESQSISIQSLQRVLGLPWILLSKEYVQESKWWLLLNTPCMKNYEKMDFLLQMER